MKLYIAGKVKKDSSFGTHHWRDGFIAELSRLNDTTYEHLDPLGREVEGMSPQEIFEKDCRLIAECDVFIVYLSDDISVGASQEILIARFYKKPVIGLAPKGGKFNEATREMFGKMVTNYKDPFVFSTCDIVCSTIEDVATALTHPLPRSTGLDILKIDN